MRNVLGGDKGSDAAAPARGRSEAEPVRRGWLSAFVDEALTPRSMGYRRLAAALRHEIATEKILVGEQLPSQRELARRLGVGRTTVVGAYNVLRSESLVCTRRGAGTWVVGRPDGP
jgi:DNA-binding GntR family transcriptional regulator